MDKQVPPRSCKRDRRGCPAWRGSSSIGAALCKPWVGQPIRRRVRRALLIRGRGRGPRLRLGHLRLEPARDAARAHAHSLCARRVSPQPAPLACPLVRVERLGRGRAQPRELGRRLGVRGDSTRGRAGRRGARRAAGAPGEGAELVCLGIAWGRVCGGRQGKDGVAVGVDPTSHDDSLSSCTLARAIQAVCPCCSLDPCIYISSPRFLPLHGRLISRISLAVLALRYPLSRHTSLARRSCEAATAVCWSSVHLSR